MPPGSLCRSWLLALLLISLAGCTTSSGYQAYPGSTRPESEIAVVIGQQYLRQDWLNRYVDAVRFSHVDGAAIEGSERYRRVELTPGTHDITIYFYWDLGSQRGLAQALVQYASSRQTLSRTLSLNVRAGERYTVLAQPVFTEGERRDITTMAYVDFWVEDEDGNDVVSREQGRYISIPQ
ncbi:MAG: hypothetical protein WD396_01545 [Pseudohongiellaceae bacterium]